MTNPSPSPDDPLDRLFAEARATFPDTTASEYALETRVLARIREQRNAAPAWFTLPWKMLPFFASIILVVALWQQETLQASSDAERLVFNSNPQTVQLWEALN